MLELPRHHVARPALIERLADAPVIVVEAPSGFGKSTLTAELARDRHVVGLALTAPGASGLLLPLRRALGRAGHGAAVAALERAAVDPVDSLDAMLDALHGTAPLTLVVDDAHQLGADAGLLVQLVDRRPPNLSLVIAARALPESATALHTRPGVAHVAATDLRFGSDLAGCLLRDGFGLTLDDRAVERLVAAADGWPAALALAGVRMQRTGVESAAGLDEGLATAALAVVPDDLAEAATHLAYLPWVDADLADVAAGRPSVLDRLVEAGLPFTVDTDGHYRLPGSVADALTRRGPCDLEVAARAAAWHLDAGHPDEALAVLRGARAWESMAATLLALTPAARAALTPGEIVSAVDALPAEAVLAHPDVLVEQARALAALGAREQERSVLDRAERLVQQPTAAFARAIETQRAAAVMYSGDADAARHRADAVLAAAGPGEERTIARALAVSGIAAAWAAQRPEATRALTRATELFTSVGEPHQAAVASVQLGFGVELHEDLRVAERTFDRAVRLAAGDDRSRAMALTYRGETRAWLGRRDESAADFGEALGLARIVRDARAEGYAAWGLALVASLEGDAARTRAFAEAAERALSEWSDTLVGLTFVAGIADILDRAGATADADAMLARAVARRDELSDMVGLSELAITARRGNPHLVEAMWSALSDDPGIEPFERLRCGVLRAYAALRRDDPAVAELRAAALHDADVMGLGDFPATMERVAWEALEMWAAATDGTWEVHCLGPLEVTRGGIVVDVPAGRPASLLGLLAATGTPQRVPWVIDALWPGVPERDGRTRLRQVLYRLRGAGLDLVERDDDVLSLRAGVVTDLQEFEHQARRSDDAAERAVRRVRGPVLDGDDLLLGLPEIEGIRERVRVRRLALLDRLVAAALAAGDRRGAIDWATAAHAADPAGEGAALRLIDLLVDAGRDVDARAVAAATIHALAQLDLEPSDTLRAAAHT